MNSLVSPCKIWIWQHIATTALPLIQTLVLLFLGLSGATNAATQHVVPDTLSQRLAACYSCHGKQGQATSSGYYPRIAGKPAGYLFNQLMNFRDGRRSNQSMTYLLDQQSDTYLQEMADFFASQHPPYIAPQSSRVSAPVLERGRLLVTSGDATRHIPACVACHGKLLTGLAPAIPGLAGLPQDYLNAQLGAWKGGIRHAAAPDCMAQIASRLTSADINAVAAWLSSQQMPATTPSALALPTSLPLSCGSVPQKKD